MKVKPFIQWVGGKQSLLPVISNRLPEKFNSYYEFGLVTEYSVEPILLSSETFMRRIENEF